MAITPAYLFHWLQGNINILTKGLILLSMFLLSISPILSFINIRIGSFRTRGQVASIDYIIYWGIPIPIPRVSIAEQETIVAINLGGAVVPVLVGIVFVYSTILMGNHIVLYTTFASIIVTTIYTYLSSRVIPGVGIAAPGLGIALVSLATSIPALNQGPIFIPAYVGASFGSLLGADVLRLMKNKDRINAPLISIGGAGVFDGIYLSGALAVTLGMLFA
ncbi:MAG: DUF1614 domain-containing protein [Desulfurococcales archaeon]|nr:DUF1614 domain-containing protein [Desulfurococcales archaeon]